MAAYPVELDRLRNALAQHPSAESVAAFAELARAAQQEATLSVAVHETLVAEGCAAMASEFCMQVAALLRGSAAPGSLKRAFNMYETVAKTTPEDFRAYLEMGNMR